MMMGSHGILVAADAPGLAWDLAYHLERAAKTYVTALSTGRPLNVLDHATAEKTARQWEQYGPGPGYHQIHLEAMMAVLDAADDSYRH